MYASWALAFFLTTAYLLSEEGNDVVVLDDGLIASGETSRTTAHLVNALDDRYFELESMHGEKGARLGDRFNRRLIGMRPRAGR
jgi:glycine/D-amino acid oxidase-like deaminating enzyme